MDFRLYDNALGRFFGIDALSEQNHYLSTYQFGDGNPVVFSDPSGMDAVQYMWENTEQSTTWTNSGNGFTNDSNFDFVSINAGNSTGGSSGGFGDIGGTLNRLNIVVMDGSKSGKDLKADEALVINKKAVKKLNSNVIVIEAKSVPDLIAQLADHLKGGKFIGNLIILGHGGYDSSISIGSTVLSTDEGFSALGESLKPYVDKHSVITFSHCHIGGGSALIESSSQLQALSDSSGANILGNMTWGAASVARFNSDDSNKITYANYQPGQIPPKEKKSELIREQLNAMTNRGNFLLVKPNICPTIVNSVYFTQSGNVIFNRN
jgi:hypothetical protein